MSQQPPPWNPQQQWQGQQVPWQGQPNPYAQAPQAAPPPSGVPMWAKLLLIAGGFIGLIVVAVVAFPETKARVECQPAASSFNCTVEHVQGRSNAHVCWDVVMACRNGTRAVGHACQDVTPDARASKIIPEADVQNLAQCDSATGITIEHLTVSLP